MKSLDWLLKPNEEVWAEEQAQADARAEAKYGPCCPVCGYRVYSPSVQPPDHPGQPHGTDVPHDCFTGDPLGR